ncbi:MAG: hypothetical protein IJU72_00245 [Bacteroidales bacterium]|nr:hypothetical protein [Bacteroidales bacterium]
MSTEKTNIEKFEDFELTPENAKKVEGGWCGDDVVVICWQVEAVRCWRKEAKYCGPNAAVEIRGPICPWPAEHA